MRYLYYFIFFGTFLALLLVCRGEDITQKCFANDSFSLLYGCKFLEIRYPVPLYTFVGWPIANLPFGVDGGNLILFLSVIPAFISSILVFAIIKKKSDYPLAPWFGAAVLMGCYSFFSQAIVIEVYMLLSMFMIAGYCAVAYNRFALAAILVGLAMSCHYLTGGFLFVALIVAFKDFRRFWYCSMVVFLAVFLTYYLAVPTFKWQLSSGDMIASLIGDIFVVMLRNFSVLIETIPETIAVFVVSFGLALIPIYHYAMDFKKSYWLIFIIYFPCTYLVIHGYAAFVTLVPFVPFLAVMAGLGLEKMKRKHFEKVLMVLALIMMFSMPFTINIDKVDSSETTARQMINELDSLNDGDVVLGLRMYVQDDGIKFPDTLGGHISAVVEYYNKENGTKIIPIQLTWIFDPETRESIKELDEIEINFPNSHYVTWLGQQDRALWYQRCVCFFYLCNLDNDIYWYEYVNLETEELKLVKVVDSWDLQYLY